MISTYLKKIGSNMTCIIALKKDDTIYWGADSCVTGYGPRTMSRPKIFQVGDLVFGGSGTLRMLQVMEYHLKPKKHKGGVSDMEYIVTKIVPKIRTITKDCGQLEDNKSAGDGEKSGAYFLIGYHGEIYQLGFDFSVSSPVESYEAIGSGQFHALGSLWASTKKSPQTAIEDALGAAEFFNAGVRAPFLFYKQVGAELEALT